MPSNLANQTRRTTRYEHPGHEHDRAGKNAISWDIARRPRPGVNDRERDLVRRLVACDGGAFGFRRRVRARARPEHVCCWVWCSVPEIAAVLIPSDDPPPETLLRRRHRRSWVRTADLLAASQPRPARCAARADADGWLPAESDLLADADDEGDLAALGAGESFGTQESCDRGGLAGSGPGVARRGAVLKPREQVR
jgi:hypothetical protein